MELFLKRVFAIMFGGVTLTAIAAWATLYMGGIWYLIDPATGSMTMLYHILLWGGLAFVIWAQTKIFSFKPAIGAVLMAVYSVLIGITMTPLIALSLAINPMSILYAFGIAALMFGCMALFGYKTTANLSFLGRFLFIGMIGLIITGAVSYIWPLGDTFATIVCAIGVLIFALFTAYDIQTLKTIYPQIKDDKQKNQLAVLGALHMYISFVAMFQYILSLINRR